MLKNTITILLYFFIGSLAFDGEAVVELVNDDNYKSENTVPEIKTNSENEDRRSFPYPQSPFIKFVRQAAPTKYVSKSAGDFFDFLRDSYPLPGGLTSPLPEYDFIVVGAGSAGCVIASRLSEDKKTTVLLLEAGKPEMLLTDIPVMAPYFQSTDYVWQYYMEPQPGVCKGMINERCFWPRGKAVGGTSVINYMIYTRGRPQEWDRIAAAGNYGWSYNDVIEYYMKSEQAKLDGYEKSPYRSQSGEVPVEFAPIKTKLIKAFLESGRILGHPTVDYNAPDFLGFGYVQAIISKGHRQSAAKTFLHKQKKRHNLHILPESVVTKILIDPETNTAYGVEYVRNGLKHVAKARKEVIISAGPIASPQLLMLSGIGPKDHLTAMEIPIIKDLPVGRTLYDHICFPGLIFELNTTNVSFNERTISLRSIIQWLKNGDNMLSSPGAVEGIGYIKTPISDDPEPVPDIELISIGGSILSDGGPGGSKSVRKGMRLNEDIFTTAFGQLDESGKDTWSTFPMLLKPESVGRLELRNNDPFSHPRMYGNYLTSPKDVATFIAAIRHVQEMVATAPFQRFGAKVYNAQYPGCRHVAFNSDAYWECALRMLTATLHHQVATCRMGPEGDSLAVVDPELRVLGVNRLRVADSSVIPVPISAHTHAPAMMIGEKATDMIKSTWSQM